MEMESSLLDSDVDQAPTSLEPGLAQNVAGAILSEKSADAKTSISTRARLRAGDDKCL